MDDPQVTRDASTPEDKTVHPYYPRHHDDEWIDEIRIVTVPRFKESELSGDEWRTSVRMQILRKGIVLRERRYGKIADALLGIGSDVGSAPADFTKDEPGWDSHLTDGKCGSR